MAKMLQVLSYRSAADIHRFIEKCLILVKVYILAQYWKAMLIDGSFK